jgi:hypothetical protein
MSRQISMATRAELLGAIGARYRESTGAEKTRILDEFVAVTGYHRKHAIRLLRIKERVETSRRSRPVYGPRVCSALAALWEASDRVCSKRLKVMIPVLLPALERHGTIQIDAKTRDQLLVVSPATIDRLLSEIRIVAGGRRRRRAGSGSAVQRSVPVRTFNDWKEPPPGFVEIDFVAHSGVSVGGGFVQTLVLTDIATGWTECIPVLLRESGLVIEAIMKAQELFPFKLRGVDFDNDSVFMNELVVDWCRAQGLEVTRSRAYKKNDQAWVEQKNGAIVRRMVGYGRFEGLEAVIALTRLYAASRLHVNVFQASFKLREKKRIGAKVIKRYHPPVPPIGRVLAQPELPAWARQALEQMRAVADPVLLLAEMRAAQSDLGRRVDQRGLPREPVRPTVIDLPSFATTLETAWKAGEQRPTHRRPYTRRKPRSPRPSMLDPYVEQIRSWLGAAPTLPAVEILERLIRIAPETFHAGHLRTVQRGVKAWRLARARKLILQGAWTMAPIASVPAEAGTDAIIEPQTSSL